MVPHVKENLTCLVMKEAEFSPEALTILKTLVNQESRFNFSGFKPVSDNQTGRPVYHTKFFLPEHTLPEDALANMKKELATHEPPLNIDNVGRGVEVNAVLVGSIVGNSGGRVVSSDLLNIANTLVKKEPEIARADLARRAAVLFPTTEKDVKNAAE
ncbi:MAG: hypothetical protein HEQ32_08530 [Vampirovibrio sp.]